MRAKSSSAKKPAEQVVKAAHELIDGFETIE